MKHRSSVSKTSALRPSVRWATPFIVWSLLLLGIGSARAQRITVTINGDPVAFQGLGPIQLQGRTLVPVRGVLEKLGAQVAWVPQSQSVIASSGNIDIQLHLGDRHATVNGKDILLDVPAQEIDGHTMVPLRFLGEALGAQVGWDGATNTVLIVTNGGSNTPRHPDNPRPGDRDRPARAPVSVPKIGAVSFRAPQGVEWLKPGSEIAVRMEGTPGGQGFFRVPGLTDEIPMSETAPGVYTGAWVVTRDHPVQLANATVVGVLKVGDQSSAPVQAQGGVSIDAAPPKIRDRAPDPDSRVGNARPNIYAVFDDAGGSGVAANTIRLILNGQDVTANATVNRDFISYNPPAALPPGPVAVEIVAEDRAGNRVRSGWTFTELSKEGDIGIRSVKDNADHPLGPGDVLHVEMTGMPGGSAAFSVGNIKDVKLLEVQPGRYAADYTIRKGDDASRGALSVRLMTRDGGTFVQQDEHAVSVVTGKPMVPVITYPGANDTIADPLVIRGKATPNTQVHVKVDYRDRVLGGLGLKGTAADAVVTADRNGNWQTAPIELRNLFSNRNMDYTISATGSNANQTSDTVRYQFKLR